MQENLNYTEMDQDTPIYAKVNKLNKKGSIISQNNALLDKMHQIFRAEVAELRQDSTTESELESRHSTLSKRRTQMVDQKFEEPFIHSSFEFWNVVLENGIQKQLLRQKDNEIETLRQQLRLAASKSNSCEKLDLATSGSQSRLREDDHPASLVMHVLLDDSDLLPKQGIKELDSSSSNPSSRVSKEASDTSSTEQVKSILETSSHQSGENLRKPEEKEESSSKLYERYNELDFPLDKTLMPIKSESPYEIVESEAETIKLSESTKDTLPTQTLEPVYENVARGTSVRDPTNYDPEHDQENFYSVPIGKPKTEETLTGEKEKPVDGLTFNGSKSKSVDKKTKITAKQYPDLRDVDEYGEKKADHQKKSKKDKYSSPNQDHSGNVYFEDGTQTHRASFSNSKEFIDFDRMKTFRESPKLKKKSLFSSLFSLSGSSSKKKGIIPMTYEERIRILGIKNPKRKFESNKGGNSQIHGSLSGSKRRTQRLQQQQKEMHCEVDERYFSTSHLPGDCNWESNDDEFYYMSSSKSMEHLSVADDQVQATKSTILKTQQDQKAPIYNSDPSDDDKTEVKRRPSKSVQSKSKLRRDAADPGFLQLESRSTENLQKEKVNKTKKETKQERHLEKKKNRSHKEKHHRRSSSSDAESQNVEYSNKKVKKTFSSSSQMKDNAKTNLPNSSSKGDPVEVKSKRKAKATKTGYHKETQQGYDRQRSVSSSSDFRGEAMGKKHDKLDQTFSTNEHKRNSTLSNFFSSTKKIPSKSKSMGELSDKNTKRSTKMKEQEIPNWKESSDSLSPFDSHLNPEDRHSKRHEQNLPLSPSRRDTSFSGFFGSSRVPPSNSMASRVESGSMRHSKQRDIDLHLEKQSSSSRRSRQKDLSGTHNRREKQQIQKSSIDHDYSGYGSYTPERFPKSSNCNSNKKSSSDEAKDVVTTNNLDSFETQEHVNSSHDSDGSFGKRSTFASKTRLYGPMETKADTGRLDSFKQDSKGLPENFNSLPRMKQREIKQRLINRHGQDDYDSPRKETFKRRHQKVQEKTDDSCELM